MDPIISLSDLTDPIARLTAMGTAITVLTEVMKEYIPEDRLPPPLIAGVIALVFAAAWEWSALADIRLVDPLAALLLWFSLFQVSIGVYHGTKLAQKRRAKKPAQPVVAPPRAEQIEQRYPNALNREAQGRG